MSIFKLNIAEPCREDWQNMTPNNLGRHCQNCQKTVVDFLQKPMLAAEKPLQIYGHFPIKADFH